MNAAAALSDLVGRFWDAVLERVPTRATLLGDLRFNDRLEELSPAAHAEWHEQLRGFRSRLDLVPQDGLDREWRITREVLSRMLDESLEEFEHRPWEFEVDALAGPQLLPQHLVSFHPLDTAEHIEHLARRYEAYGRYLDGYVAALREGLVRGRTAYRGVVERVVRQLEAALATPAEKSELFAAGRLEGAPEELRQRILRAWRGVVMPAWAALRDFLVQELLPRARAEPGLAAIDGGRAAYGWMVRHHTTTQLTPEQIHQIGWEELERLGRQMEEVARRRGHTGNAASFIAAVRADRAHFFTTREEVVGAFRAAVGRITPHLPRLFGRLPAIGLEVRPIEAYREVDAPAAYYQRPPDPQQGAPARPGIFYINTHRPETRPRYNVTALAAHEAVPGHHLQIALATELRGLPPLRRHTGPNAYVEGWALYAELLVDELGLYEDDMQRFGMLSEQAWRAARLVVDTGLHEMGWSRDQAIEVMLRHVGLTRPECENEIDRYIAWPGQALAYTIGRRRFQELRRRAGAADPRSFHDEVLGHGALPLAVLESIVLGA